MTNFRKIIMYIYFFSFLPKSEGGGGGGGPPQAPYMSHIGTVYL